MAAVAMTMAQWMVVVLAIYLLILRVVLGMEGRRTFGGGAAI
jgi:hypothetical protein